MSSSLVDEPLLEELSSPQKQLKMLQRQTIAKVKICWFCQKMSFEKKEGVCQESVVKAYVEILSWALT